MLDFALGKAVLYEMRRENILAEQGDLEFGKVDIS